MQNRPESIPIVLTGFARSLLFLLFRSDILAGTRRNTPKGNTMKDSVAERPGFTKRLQLRDGKAQYMRMQVKDRQQITPRYVRITLTAPDFDVIHFISPDDDVRIAIPLDLDAKPGDLRIQHEPEYKVIYPEDAPPYLIKAYTICRLDREMKELDLEVAIHDQGHGVHWATNAKPGQEVLVAGAWGSYLYEGDLDHVVLIGDETAMPAIRHWVSRLEAPQSATVIAEVHNENEHLPIHPNEGVNVSVNWVYRRDLKPGRHELLRNAVKELISKQPNTLYWGAGESSTLREIRRYLVGELGIPPNATQLGGYWKREDDKDEWFVDRFEKESSAD